MQTTTVEIAYSGSMGIHLFMPQENINPKNSALLSAQNAANISTTATITDPLGRINPFTGAKSDRAERQLGKPLPGVVELVSVV